MNSKTIVVFALLMILAACDSGKGRLVIDAGDLPVEKVVIRRYEQALFKLNRADLQNELERIKPSFPFFLGTDLSDPAKISDMAAYLDDRRNREFFDEVSRKYRDLTAVEKDLSDAFRHFRYYFPSFGLPKVYTYISGGDYTYPVQFADSVLLIGIDNYLGPEFKPYAADGLPKYRLGRMTEEYIVPDCMKTLCRFAVPERFAGNTMLEQMVEAGKRLLLLDAMIPEYDDRRKAGYSQAQYDWILANEKHVWAAIIENRMLYSTDAKLIRTFLADGPFTAEFSRDAPARLGEWIGWQIVRDYYENRPDVSLLQLLNEKDAQKILTESGYKP